MPLENNSWFCERCKEFFQAAGGQYIITCPHCDASYIVSGCQ